MLPKENAEVQIIELPNVLRQKVFLDAKGVDHSVLEKAQEALLDMADAYRVYAERDLANINKCFQALKQKGNWDSHIVANLYGSAHELKGQAGTFGYKMMSEVAGRMSKFIDLSRKRTVLTTLDTEILQILIRALELAFTQTRENDIDEETSILLQGFEQLFAKALRV